jgi:NAD(P)-dependent dehydrogenase (short-subunit alcohol dehydrogenase family)
MKKTVLITGTSSGIGKASAKLFASSGWHVIATMRSPQREAELAALSDVLVTRLDVQDRDSIGQAIAAGISRFGRIDALINNAGYGQYGVFESIPREKIQEQFDVNVFGVMDVTRAILPHFRKNKAGVIVNVSSGAGIFTLPMISLYCASKFALEGFSEALSYELASQNITVKIVEPHGGVDGTRFPERSAGGRGTDATIADYDDFLKRTSAVLTGVAPARKASAEEVARVIFGAATDGTDRLRYLIGDDTRGFIKARRELPDQEYMDFMKSRLFPKP